jgi:hypothetical protein
MKGFYSVFNPRGEKIADCGAEKDVINLIRMRNCRWDGHYYTFIPLSGDIVDVLNNQLPPNQKYIGFLNVTDKEFDRQFIEVNEQKNPT